MVSWLLRVTLEATVLMIQSFAGKVSHFEVISVGSEGRLVPGGVLTNSAERTHPQPRSVVHDINSNTKKTNKKEIRKYLEKN